MIINLKPKNILFNSLVIFLLFMLNSNKLSCKELPKIIHTINANFFSNFQCAQKADFIRELNKLTNDWEDETTLSFDVNIQSHLDFYNVILTVHDKEKIYTRSVNTDKCSIIPKLSAILIAITLDPMLVGDFEDLDLLGNNNTEDIPKNDNKPNILNANIENIENKTNINNNSSFNNKNNNKNKNTKSKNKRQRTINTALSFYVTSNIGTLTSLAGGPGMEFQFLYGLSKLSLSVDSFFTKKTFVTQNNKGTFSVNMLSFTIGTGWQINLRALSIQPTIGLSFNNIFAKTEGIIEDKKNTSLILSVWIALDFYFRIIKSFGVMAHAGIEQKTKKVRYYLNDDQTILNTGNLSGIFKFGLFFIF